MDMNLHGGKTTMIDFNMYDGYAKVNEVYVKQYCSYERFFALYRNKHLYKLAYLK